MMNGLFGGSPEEVPEAYLLFSPIEHVGPHCPPTLLLQGEHDCIVPVEGARSLNEKLRAAGTPVIYVEYPLTEHAFDLILPQISLPAQAALYETERFLALLAD
jgi:acetyl esterase/lipase